jgi:hypothetical protein
MFMVVKVTITCVSVIGNPDFGFFFFPFLKSIHEMPSERSKDDFVGIILELTGCTIFYDVIKK